MIELLPQVLLLLGIGFMLANLRLAMELMRWRRRRPGALVIWPAPKPPYYGLSLGLGVLLGLLVLLKAYLQLGQHANFSDGLMAFGRAAFGELMMFVYFGYALPLSTRIARGLYADGIWADNGFLSYDQIAGIGWREEPEPTLMLIPRTKAVARRLEVPGPKLGEVRRVLRDKITSHAIEVDSGPGLHLGERDARDSV